MLVNLRLKIETDIFKARGASRTMVDDGVPYDNQCSDGVLS